MCLLVTTCKNVMTHLPKSPFNAHLFWESLQVDILRNLEKTSIMYCQVCTNTIKTNWN
jgi:hypothetical protein